MLLFQEGAEGHQEAGENPARSRHCNRGASPIEGHCVEREGRGEASIREPGDWPAARHEPDRGEDPEEEVSMDRVAGKASLPIWLALIALALFAVLFDNGLLLAPLFGEAAPNYLHELFHDGRHVLGAPCH
jgi:Probable cobalt transporter subunit (CbtB)